MATNYNTIKRLFGLKSKNIYSKYLLDVFLYFIDSLLLITLPTVTPYLLGYAGLRQAILVTVPIVSWKMSTWQWLLTCQTLSWTRKRPQTLESSSKAGQRECLFTAGELTSLKWRIFSADAYILQPMLYFCIHYYIPYVVHPRITLFHLFYM